MTKQTFREFLLNENPMGGMGDPAGGGAPLGADPMGGGAMGGGMPPMGGGPMDPMGGGMGGPPMGGGAPGGEQQVPVHIKDADIWTVLDHLLNNKPLPKQKEQPAVPDDGGMGMDAGAPAGGDPMGGAGMMDPMGGDPMGAPPMGGGMPGAPAPMGGGLMS